MPSTINADTGAITGTTAIVQTADGSGELSLQANGNTVVTLTTNRLANFAGNVSAANVAVTGVVRFNDGTTMNTAPTSASNITSAGNVTITAAGGIINAQATTGGFILPTGTFAQRPANAAAGTMRYNTSNNITEVYSGLAWIALSSQIYNIDYIIVAGGGSGGTASGYEKGGGGGAGGYLIASALSVTGGTAYTITIGAGGATSASGGGGNPGSNSSISSVNTAIGGGRGGSGGTAGQAGGSGGGGSAWSPGVVAGGAGTSGQGSAGGNGVSQAGSGPGTGCGGGGGKSSVGGNASLDTGGSGGAGLADTWTGSTRTLAGGGGGAGANPGSGGAGGGGGGGANGATGTAGAVNTGGGGGGGGYEPGLAGGAGGSGIVVIRYLGSQVGSGGTVTSSGGYTIHTFTGSGTFTA